MKYPGFNSQFSHFCHLSSTSQSNEKIVFSCRNKACLKKTNAGRLPIPTLLALECSTRWKNCVFMQRERLQQEDKCTQLQNPIKTLLAALHI